MRVPILAPILAMAGLIAAGAAFPAMAQQDSCLDEIQRLEAAFAQGGGPAGDQAGASPQGGGTPNADRAQSSATSREAISRDLARSGGTVAPSSIGSGVGSEQPDRGVEPVPLGRNPGQQPGTRAGATITPQQRDDMAAMLREGRAAAERGDTGTCLDKVRQARQTARSAMTGAGGG
ncbi:hypothetical protein JL101_017945 [Skermanella rosea]|uniref:hypothetical protein n=1 Tax=Skermanella rosea TaxID=1817965 RepID=UPI0019313694|nr:hypothetical protein [Skermanella rosea]UEM01877.1 hypothetical protein JL101_017945 [Skermanella rosea]